MASSRQEREDAGVPRWSRLAAIGSLTVVVAMLIAGVWVSLRFDPALAEVPDFEPLGAGFFVGILPFIVSGAYLAWRKPSNAVGWWLIAIALFWAAGSLGVIYGTAGMATEHGPLPGDMTTLIVTGPLWAPGLVSIGMVMFLFPTGEPVSPRWRWLIYVAIGIATLLYGTTMLRPDLLTDIGATNPLGWEAGLGVLDTIEGVASLAMFVLVGLVVVSMVIRYRRSQGVERQQMKWLVYVAIVLAAVAALGSLRDQFDWKTLSPLIDGIQALGVVALALIPVAIAVAVMKYGLYDLGRIVNRTIVYTVLAVLLTAVYVGGVLLTTLVRPGEDHPVSVAGSTLAAAALFNPLRRRIQTAVDRRFNRLGYGPDEVQTDLRHRLRTSLHPEDVADDLLHVVNDALEPATASVWIQEG